MDIHRGREITFWKERQWNIERKIGRPEEVRQRDNFKFIWIPHFRRNQTGKIIIITCMEDNPKKTKNSIT